MVIRPVVIAVVCVGLFLILESLMLPKAIAVKSNSLRMEDQRTYKRRNHMLQRARDKEILKSLQKRGVSFDTEIELLDAAFAIPELAYIEDYANTIDDEYFLDKSVETRTRKRGNFKREKYVNQAIPDPPCGCKSMNTVEHLEDNVFPRKITTKKCSRTQQGSNCAPPYKCQEVYYSIPVLKRKPFGESMKDVLESFEDLVPNNLSSWTAVFKKIAVGCQCTNQYAEKNTEN